MARATILLALVLAASRGAPAHGQELISTATPDPIVVVLPAAFQAPAEQADAAPAAAAPMAVPAQPATPAPAMDLSRQFSAAGAAAATAARTAAASARLAQAPEMFGDSASVIGLTSTVSALGENGEVGDVTTSVQFPAGSFGLKVSDNNSPLPRDRVYYRFSNYSELIKVNSQAVSASVNQAFSTPRSLPVHTIGLEKTLFEGMASIEVRAPFSERVNVNEFYVTDGFEFFNDAALSTAGEGNVAAIAKVVLGSSDDLLWAGGVAVETPTGRDSDFRLGEFSGEYLNKAVYLYPYLAALWTPDEQWFHQAFWGVNVPVNDDELVLYDPTLLQQVELGRTDVELATLMSFDWSTGYWLWRDRGDRWVTGLALLGELHYTTSLGTPDAAAAPLVTGGAGSVDLVNLTGGVHVQLGPTMSLRVAGVIPVADRPFDNEVTAQWTYWY